MNDQYQVSAMVPACNNAKTLLKVIESIDQQTYTAQEYFIIDDASSDQTPAIAKKAGWQVYRFETNQGRGRVRAYGLEKAQYPYVLSVDATARIQPDFLEKALPYFEDDQVAAVFGRIEDPNPQGVVSRWRKRHLFGQEYYAAFSQYASLQTAAIVFRKDIIVSIGNFDKTLSAMEDRDLGQRLLAKGWKVVYSPLLKVAPLSQDTLIQVLRRFTRWNMPLNRSMTFQEYIKMIIYSIKVMAIKDIQKKDYRSALISLLAPHYQYWSSTIKK